MFELIAKIFTCVFSNLVLAFVSFSLGVMMQKQAEERDAATGPVLTLVEEH